MLQAPMSQNIVESQFLDQTVLEGTVDSFHAAFGLAGVGVRVAIGRKTGVSHRVHCFLSVPMPCPSGFDDFQPVLPQLGSRRPEARSS